MTNWQTVYIGLGSNLEHPLVQIQQAVSALQALPKSRNLKCSPLYQSKAIGPPQPDYINAVCELQTQMQALPLLDALQAIELAQHRRRLEHWGPRTLDLDILLYGQANIHSERLKIPHTEMLNRNFVLAPLADLAPQVIIHNRSIQEWLTTVGREGLVKLASRPEAGILSE